MGAWNRISPVWPVWTGDGRREAGGLERLLKRQAELDQELLG